MTDKIYAVFIGAAAICMVFYAGMRFEQSRNANAQIAQLKTDANSVIAIKEKDDEKKQKVDNQVRIVREKAPDWSGVALPDAVLGGMRDAGISTKP